MHALLAPILAQAVTLFIGDRTEFRSVHDLNRNDLEAESRPAAGFRFAWPRLSLGAVYEPSLTVAPLEDSTTREREFRTTPDREVQYLHAARGQARLTLGKPRTTWSFDETVHYAQRNLLREAIAGGLYGGAPSSPVGGAPPGGAVGGTIPSVANPSAERTNWGSARSAVDVTHELSRTHSLGVALGYEVSGGLDTPSRESLPPIHGPDGRVLFRTLLSPRDSLASIVAARYTLGTLSESQGVVPGQGTHTRGYYFVFVESVEHLFSRQLRGILAAGGSYSWQDQPGLPPTSGVLPSGAADLDYRTRVAKGTFQARAGVSFAPFLDPTTVTIDDRLSSRVLIGWEQGRTELILASQGTISTSNSPSSIAMLNATAGALYDLGSGFRLDGGVRFAWQRLQEQDTVPRSGTIFVAGSYAWSDGGSAKPTFNARGVP